MCVLTAPPAFRVFQRQGFSFARAHVNSPTPEARGSARIEVRGRSAGGVPRAIEAQVAGLGDARPLTTPWTAVEFAAAGDEFGAWVQVPAGGWFVISIRVHAASDRESTCECGPVGAGEVYVIAGQSYASNSHDSLLTVEDAEGRVVAFDAALGGWRVGHDPQPDGALPETRPVGDPPFPARDAWSARARTKLVPGRRIYGGGSIWPATMGLLQRTLNVPVGILNVAAGGTAIHEWLPGGTNHARLLSAASTAGSFRAVLWQQGESDVIAETPTTRYLEQFRAVRSSLERHVGAPVDWLVAKSTYHPAVYSKPGAECELREAIETLWQQGAGVFRGPDTDQLGAFARSPRGRSQHFTRDGQVVAGAMWYAALLRHLEGSAAQTLVG